MGQNLSFGSGYGSVPSYSPAVPLSFGVNAPEGYDPVWDFGSRSRLPLSFGTIFGGAQSVAGSGKSTGAAPALPARGSASVNTANLDGSAGFQNGLSGLGASVLESLGGQRDAPAPYLQNASWGASEPDTNWMMIAALAAGAFGIYYMVS